MEELIKALEVIYSSNEIGSNCGVYFSECEEVNLTETLACAYLITEEGHCDWDNINKLRELGYQVFRGDGDSFGWLTGCIKKKGDTRILVYG